MEDPGYPVLMQAYNKRGGGGEWGHVPRAYSWRLRCRVGLSVFERCPLPSLRGACPDDGPPGKKDPTLLKKSGPINIGHCGDYGTPTLYRGERRH
jgi:hypothetical protein